MGVTLRPSMLSTSAVHRMLCPAEILLRYVMSSCAVKAGPCCGRRGGANDLEPPSPPTTELFPEQKDVRVCVACFG